MHYAAQRTVRWNAMSTGRYRPRLRNRGQDQVYGSLGTVVWRRKSPDAKRETSRTKVDILNTFLF